MPASLTPLTFAQAMVTFSLVVAFAILPGVAGDADRPEMNSPETVAAMKATFDKCTSAQARLQACLADCDQHRISAALLEGKCTPYAQLNTIFSHRLTKRVHRDSWHLFLVDFHSTPLATRPATQPSASDAGNDWYLTLQVDNADGDLWGYWFTNARAHAAPPAEKPAADTLEKFKTRYRACANANERRSVAIDAINARIIAIGANIEAVDAVFGTSMVAEWRRGDRMGGIEFQPEDPAKLQRSYRAHEPTGWYVDIDYDAKGIITYYYLSQIYKGLEPPKKPEL